MVLYKNGNHWLDEVNRLMYLIFRGKIYGDFE